MPRDNPEVVVMNPDGDAVGNATISGDWLGLLPKSYTYDWTAAPAREGRPWTDDPEWEGKSPPFGVPPNRVTLNGEDVSHLRITRLKTGSVGWVEFVVTNSAGEPVIDHEAGKVKKVVTPGFVRWWVEPEAAGGKSK